MLRGSARINFLFDEGLEYHWPGDVVRSGFMLYVSEKVSEFRERCSEVAFASPGSLRGISNSKTRVWPGNRVKSCVPSRVITESCLKLVSGTLAVVSSPPTSTSFRTTLASSRVALVCSRL